MDTRDRIVTALSPGSPFNTHGLIWRSIQALSQFAGTTVEETLEIMAGDMADIVVIRPSTTGKGLLAALKDQIPKAANPGEGEIVSIAGGPAFNPPSLEAAPQPLEEAPEMPEPPVAEADPDPLAVGLGVDVAEG